MTEAKTNDSAPDLATLLAEPVSIKIGGETILVGAAPFGATMRMLTVAGPLIEELATNPQALADNGTLSALMVKHADRATALCALAIGKPQKWVEALPIDDGLTLFAEVLRANAHFFHLAVTQLISLLASRQRGMSSLTPMVRPSASAGQMSSAH